jgi:Protein of unknown function (DUF1572)
VFMEPTILEFKRLKDLGDRAIAQLGDQELNNPLAPGGNSVAVIVRHLAGNMRSRWTDFLTSDGEKPDRNRDSEFDETPLGRDELVGAWNGGWEVLFGALNGLSDDDMARIVTIRHEPHTVVQAIQRQLAHYAGHVHQIVLIGKCLKGTGWQTLSIPRGASESFNARMASTFAKK